MTKVIDKGLVYYTTREEVEEIKKKGDRIYYVAGTGYYIVRPKKKGFF